MPAPERVWVETADEGPRNAYLHCGSWPGDRVEYIRADLVEARTAEAVKAEREAWEAQADALAVVVDAITEMIRARGDQ